MDHAGEHTPGIMAKTSATGAVTPGLVKHLMQQHPELAAKLSAAAWTTIHGYSQTYASDCHESDHEHPGGNWTVS